MEAKQAELKQVKTDKLKLEFVMAETLREIESKQRSYKRDMQHKENMVVKIMDDMDGNIYWILILFYFIFIILFIPSI